MTLAASSAAPALPRLLTGLALALVPGLVPIPSRAAGTGTLRADAHAPAHVATAQPSRSGGASLAAEAAPASPGMASQDATVSGSQAAPPPAPVPAETRAVPDPSACIAEARVILGSDPPPPAERGAIAFAGLRACWRALLGEGRDGDALAVARAGNELLPAEAASGFDYGALLMLAGEDPSEARRVLNEALARRGTMIAVFPAERAVALGNAGRLALARGDLDAARGQLTEALALDPANVDVLYGLAAVAHKSEDAETCLRHSRRAFAADPARADRDDILVGAWAQSATGHPDRAVTLLKEGLARFPNASGLHLGLGFALAAQKRPFAALLEYLYEVENSPSDDPYAQEASRLFSEIFSATLPLPKDEAAMGDLRAVLSDRSGDPAVLIPILDRIREAGHIHPVLELTRAEVLLTAADRAAAEPILRGILATDPAFLPPYFDLSLLLRETDRAEEAGRLVAEAARRNPRHWQFTGQPPAGSD